MTNFWQAVTEIANDANNVVSNKKEYRLYYNNAGEPIFYSMDDEPGNYIVVDAETYRHGSYNIRIVNNKIVRLENNACQKLVLSNNGTECLTGDVSIIAPGQHWKLKRYE